MLTTILCLHVARAGLIFRLNSAAGRFRIQSFTADDIGDALFQRSHHADMQYIAPVRQKHLSTGPTITTCPVLTAAVMMLRMVSW